MCLDVILERHERTADGKTDVWYRAKLYRRRPGLKPVVAEGETPAKAVAELARCLVLAGQIGWYEREAIRA